MLTNEEFAELDKARVAAARQPGKSTLHLALRHIEAQNQQIAKMYALVQALAKRQDASLCRRVPRWFAMKWAQVKAAFRA